MQNIPVSTPYLGEEEKNAVLDALVKTEVSGTFGSALRDFEEGFAKYCGSPNRGFTTANGTVALHLALAALNIKQGDEVLVATLTNMATFFAVVYQGATPIPIDIERDTWNINPAFLEEKITKQTKAIIVVHLFGHPVDMDPILAIAKKHNLYVIEDAAEAHGAEYKGKKTGSLGDIGCFSFYANKIITTGEGGMVLANDEKIIARMRELGTLAYGGRENRFMHSAVGFNYRMSNLLAALGRAQLQKIETVVEMKRNIAKYYCEHLKDIPFIALPVEKEYAKNVYWMFHIVLTGRYEGKRAMVREELAKRGVDTRESFIPGNQQRILLEREFGIREDMCPVANNVGANGLYIPSGPVMNEEELQQVCDALHEVLK